MSDEEAELFIANYETTAEGETWILKGVPVRDWTKLLPRWKVQAQKPRGRVPSDKKSFDVNDPATYPENQGKEIVNRG
jgi:hypothetical protein